MTTLAKPWELLQGIYVHTPFCKQKCLYCDFPSYAGCDDLWKDYGRAVAQEIALRTNEAVLAAPQATIYFGGGTPSLLPLESIAAIVEALKQYGFWQNPAEATIEVNPGTVDLKKLQGLRQLGFDRLSFGVQSLQDAELRTIGRIHSAQQALEALELARQAGFTRLSCDLIYGLPGQSMASLQSTLAALLEQNLEHLSVYGLIVEEDTPLEALVDSGKLTLPDEDTSADMYQLVQHTLEQAGYSRYEISNYARKDGYSRHNTVYWHYWPYAGFGAGACGFYGAQRRTACSLPRQYMEKIYTAQWQALYDVEELTPVQQLGEFMFMGLRRRAGAALDEAQQRFGVDVLQRYDKELAPYFKQDLLRLNKSQLQLTPAGMAVGNRIFEIFVEE